jgi:hypothetical protein
MSGLGREIVDAMNEQAEDATRQPKLQEQRAEFTDFMRRGSTTHRSAARLAGERPLDYQERVRAEEAEARQERDERGRFASTGDDDDTTEDEPVTGRGFDGGARGGRTRDTTPPSERMSQSIRDRVAAKRGW